MKVLKDKLNKIKIVMYSPIDAGPIDYKWLKEIKDIDRFIVYTDFAKDVIEDSLRTWIKKEGVDKVKFPPINILPHGIDIKTFYPFPDVEGINGKAIAKKELLPNRSDFLDSFIVLNANRNQPRKRLDVTIKGFKLFVENKPINVKLYMHTGIEDMGWNIVNLCNRYGIDDRLIVSSINPGVQTVSDNRLNLIYNACDIGINTSVGEGWGLCNWEHAATRAAQIVPNHSSNTELWGNKRGILMEPSFSLTNERVLTEGRFVTPETVAESLELLYQDKQLRDKLANNAYKYITKPKFNWRSISKLLDKILVEVLEEELPKVEEQTDGNIVAL
jgi:glycosyltransferase involved in cell wall biosynthesis